MMTWLKRAGLYSIIILLSAVIGRVLFPNSPCFATRQILEIVETKNNGYCLNVPGFEPTDGFRYGLDICLSQDETHVQATTGYLYYVPKREAIWQR